MWLLGKQLWLGTVRAGLTVRFWADCELIHLLINGARVKTVRSHLSVNDLAELVAQAAVPASAAPLPAPDPDTTAVEIERTVSPGGIVSLGGRQLVAAEILGGRRVGIRIEAATLMFFDLDTRELLRTRPNPLNAEQVGRLRGSRPAGPPPRPSTEPVRVQRRASNTGVIIVAGQKVAPRPRPQTPDRHRDRLRNHPGDPVRRRRRARHPPHHHAARPTHQRTTAADHPTLGQDGVLNQLSVAQ
jgi:hypothetical protein